MWNQHCRKNTAWMQILAFTAVNSQLTQACWKRGRRGGCGSWKMNERGRRERKREAERPGGGVGRREGGTDGDEAFHSKCAGKTNEWNQTSVCFRGGNSCFNLICIQLTSLPPFLSWAHPHLPGSHPDKRIHSPYFSGDSIKPEIIIKQHQKYSYSKQRCKCICEALLRCFYCLEANNVNMNRTDFTFHTVALLLF